MVGALAQIIGVLLVVAGAFLLWNAWALIIGGGLLLIVPELVAAARRPRP